MDKGNWIPMDKSLTAALPRKRSYTLIEAVFSYQVDIDNGTVKGFREYSRVWGWSLKKTCNFIRNKQGTKTEQARNTQETVKFRFIKPLQMSKRQAGDKQDTKREHAGNTTIYPNTILDPNTIPAGFEHYLAVLSSIPNYPLNRDKDIQFFQEKEKDFPEIDILSLLKGWKSYLLDKPLNGKSRPRSQLHNQFELAKKWGKHQKEKPLTVSNSGPSVLDKIRQAQQEIEAHA